MFQFTIEDIQRLKKRALENDSIIKWLNKQVESHMDFDIIFPEEAIATWGHYFYCPEHSVRLEFDLNNNLKYKCPVDGRKYEGEPYKGAWWCNLLSDYAYKCYNLAVLYMITDEVRYFNKAVEILLEAARHYPDYEEHGGIPYNGPGKAFAQTITDATWLEFLAMSYDILSDGMSPDDRGFIKSNLFETGAEFLARHRTNQLHNHEVIIDSAIAIIGIILDREDIINFAVEEKYGLAYQLENGFLCDGFWFEGSVNYHYYALEYFIRYEKFARYTGYKLIDRFDFKDIIMFPLKLFQPDYNLPILNDGSFHHGIPKHADIYEFAYSIYRDDEMAFYLNKLYENNKRDNIQAFLYGMDKLPEIKTLELKDYHNDNGSGITVFRGREARYLLVKHGPYGGEHDHYDRLGISFLAYGERIAADLGTTGYGAKLHYDYYKNTGSHNTVMINEGNHPPANPKVLRYEETADGKLLEAEVKWDDTYPELDSFTIKQWDEESYRNVTMRRIILWKQDYFIDIFKVDGASDAKIDWVLHVAGELQAGLRQDKFEGAFSSAKPFKNLKNVRCLKEDGTVRSTWNLAGCRLNLYSCCAGREMFYADGLDNPSVRDISYIIQRVRGDKALFVNVFEAYDAVDRLVIADVYCQQNDDEIEINIKRKDGGVDQFIYNN